MSSIVEDKSSPVLVTGASGAIGRFVVEEVLARGRRVIALSRSAQPSRATTGVEWHVVHLGAPEELTRVIETTSARHIIHLAAELLNNESDMMRAFDANGGGTAGVLEAARRTNIQRVVYASSKAVFGAMKDVWGHPRYKTVRENHPRTPTSVYGLTKLLGEQLAEFYRNQYGLDVVSVRFGTTVGPGKGARHSGAAALSQLIENPVRGLPVQIAQGAEQRDDIMYNMEVAQGLVQICLAPVPTSPELHLSSGRLITLEDIAQVVRQEIPTAQITIGGGFDYIGFGDFYCKMSLGRARREVGFKTRFTLQGWVKDYIDRVRREIAISA